MAATIDQLFGSPLACNESHCIIAKHANQFTQLQWTISHFIGEVDSHLWLHHPGLELKLDGDIRLEEKSILRANIIDGADLGPELTDIDLWPQAFPPGTGLESARPDQVVRVSIVEDDSYVMGGDVFPDHLGGYAAADSARCRIAHFLTPLEKQSIY